MHPNKKYMQQALKQAEKAVAHNEVPVGAVIVDAQGNVIAQAYNQIERKQQQTAHAELLAINKATKKVKNWRLDTCWIYVTLQPCMMCMGLIRLSRIQGIVYGAESPLFGYQLDKDNEFDVYNKNIVIIPAIMAEDAAYLLKKFFKQKRTQCE